MAKIPFDPSDLAKIIAEELKKAGKSASTKAVNDVMKSVGGRTAKGTGRRVPKVTPQTAAGGAGRKPPKTPKTTAPAPKGKGPRKNVLGSDAEVNAYVRREGRAASQFRKQGGEISREEAIMADIYEKEKMSRRKPPKSGGAGVPAKKPSSPKKPAGGAKKELTRAEKREINIAKHYAEREKWLAEKRVESQAAKEAKRAENRAAWAKRQDEMEARRMAGREKYNKKKNGNK